MKFFISGSHFNHFYVTEFINRTYASLEEIHEFLISNWNAKVGADDEVFIIGNMFVNVEVSEANKIMKQLNGVKYLIKGDDNGYLDNPKFDTSVYEWIKVYHLIDDVEPNIVLFHYPILEWDGWLDSIVPHNNHNDKSKQKNFEKLAEVTAENDKLNATKFGLLNLEEVQAIIKHRNLKQTRQ